jgi:hypothetical protein
MVELVSRLMTLLEGAGARRWYVVETRRGDPVVIAGPFSSRRLGRVEVFHIAKAKGDPEPWPTVETFPGFPGFSAMHTGNDVYFVGRASALHDQGDSWGEAIAIYEERLRSAN